MGSAPADYIFEIKGERFMVIDAYNEDVRQPAGLVTQQQLDWIRAETEQDGPPLTVFLHYIPLKMESPWLDRRMRIENGEALHEALLPARNRLRGVFHGHLHRSSQILRDGITYTSGPSTWKQYTWHLWEDEPQVDLVYPPAYNLVYYMDDQVVVHQYTA
jgi:3',5'-cyclic AMP phosphodiesterase CpdA